MKSFLVASLFVVKETINTIIMSCCKKNPQDVSPDKVFNQDAQKDENLKYPVEDISPAEPLDIYLPNEGNAPFPTVMYVHGNDPQYANAHEVINQGILKTTLDAGYAMVAINYRLSGEAKFPAAIEDVKAAIRFIRANAKDYHRDLEKIALWGSSVGGNLVSLAGTTDN